MTPQAAASRVPLDRERILQAAIAVADAEGIDAITVRRLASELGVHFSSLYTHVPSKDAILDGMVERLLAEAALPEAYDGWQAWITTIAGALRRLARAHRGAFLVFTRRPVAGPLGTRHTEGALAAFRAAGFSVQDAADAVAGVSRACLGLAINELATAPAAMPDLSHLSAAEFPRIAEAYAADLDDPESVWDLVVESLVVGLEARPRARA